MKNNSPCLNCEKRFLGCHDRCKDYERYKYSRKQILDMKSKESSIDHIIIKGVRRSTGKK